MKVLGSRNSRFTPIVAGTSTCGRSTGRNTPWRPYRRLPPALKTYRLPWLVTDRCEQVPDQRLHARVIAALIDLGVESIPDVGCGNGFVTKRLRAPRVVGLDPSEEALSHFDGESVVGVAEDLPFEDQAFDAVVCAEVLEHLSEAVFQKAVSELNRVARRYLVIGVPYRQDLRLGMTRCADCGLRYHVDLHCRSFDGREDIATLFPEWTVAATVLCGVCPRIRSSLFRTARYWLAGSSASSQLARCPQCGSARVRDLWRGRRWLKRLFDGMAWRLRKEAVPNWLIVLLARQVGSGRGT